MPVFSEGKTDACREGMVTMMSVQMHAQVNPKPGFIITNHGDTIRGNIDFRTNEKLAKQCEFWANGSNEGHIYIVDVDDYS